MLFPVKYNIILSKLESLILFIIRKRFFSRLFMSAETLFMCSTISHIFPRKNYIGWAYLSPDFKFPFIRHSLLYTFGMGPLHALGDSTRLSFGLPIIVRGWGGLKFLFILLTMNSSQGTHEKNNITKEKNKETRVRVSDQLRYRCRPGCCR